MVSGLVVRPCKKILWCDIVSRISVSRLKLNYQTLSAGVFINLNIGIFP
jgi:hypothetical protein